MSTLTLRVVHCLDDGLLPGQVLTLDAPGGELGRRPEAELTLPSPTVSRVHARAMLADGGWLLTSLTPSNGTFLQGEALPVGQPTPLTPGTRVQLGGVLLEVLSESPEATRPVLDPLQHAPRAWLSARWDADQCEIHLGGRRLTLEPQPARALAALMASPGETVHQWDLQEAIGSGARLDRCMSKVRQALQGALSDGSLSRRAVEAGITSHEAVPSELGALSEAELLRRFVVSRRGHGYCLCVPPEAVEITRV